MTEKVQTSAEVKYKIATWVLASVLIIVIIVAFYNISIGFFGVILVSGITGLIVYARARHKKPKNTRDRVRRIANEIYYDRGLRVDVTNYYNDMLTDDVMLFEFPSKHMTVFYSLSKDIIEGVRAESIKSIKKEVEENKRNAQLRGDIEKRKQALKILKDQGIDTTDLETQ